MSYLTIVALAAAGTFVFVVLAMMASGVARSRGWHRTEGALRTTCLLVLSVLIAGTMLLLLVASGSYLYALL